MEIVVTLFFIVFIFQQPYDMLISVFIENVTKTVNAMSMALIN